MVECENVNKICVKFWQSGQEGTIPPTPKGEFRAFSALESQFSRSLGHTPNS
jgi:hypothetical protein